MARGKMGFVAAAILLLIAGIAQAVISPEAPVADLYRIAPSVLVGKVAKVDSAAKAVEADLVEAVKGAPPANRLRINLSGAGDLAKDVAAGQPVVVMTGRVKGALVHLADMWLVADESAVGNPPTWKITKVVGPTRDFPGRTSALIRLLGAVKAGKKTLLDAVYHHTWGDIREVMKVDFKATFMTAGDASGDKKADLLIVTDQGPKLFIATGAGYKDETAAWGLAGAKGSLAAFGDVNGDGKSDLLLDTLWINGGGKFAASQTGVDFSKSGGLLALTLFDVTGDKKPDAIALTKGGDVLVYENAGAMDKPWKALAPRKLWQGGGEPALAAHFGKWGGDGNLYVMVIRTSDMTRYVLDAAGGPPAGFLRLTGSPPDAAGKAGAQYFPIKQYFNSAAMDFNDGDGRPDLFVAAGGKGKNIGLVNRGHGTFFTNIEAVLAVGRKELKPTAMTAADTYGDGTQEMLVLDAAGTLYQFESPAFTKGSVAGAKSKLSVQLLPDE